MRKTLLTAIIVAGLGWATGVGAGVKGKTGKEGMVVKSADVPTHVIAGGKAGIKILIDRPKAPVYLGVLTALPGTEVPPHQHQDSTEMLYILEGQGEMRLGEQVLTVKAGDAICIPPGVTHSLKVKTEVTPLKAVQVYAPPGPEQRFKKGKAVKE